MRSDSDLRVVADFCAILGLIATALKVFWYCGSARPNETYRSFHTRMEFGEFRSPAIRARMERDPEFRTRMEALLQSRAFRLKAAEVDSTAASLRSAIEAAKPFVARVTAARTAREAAVAAAAATDPAAAADDDPGEGEKSDAVAEASARLLAVSRDEAGVLRRVTDMMSKHRAAKAAVARIIQTASLHPATREGAAGAHGRGGAVAAAAEPNRRGATGAGAAIAVEPMEIDSSAANMEEGRPLL